MSSACCPRPPDRPRSSTCGAHSDRRVTFGAGHSVGWGMSAGVFAEYRNVLVGVAYRMLGSATDAEDVVQDAWLRWSTVDPATVDDPRAYLVTITTRLAID